MLLPFVWAGCRAGAGLRFNGFLATLPRNPFPKSRRMTPSCTPTRMAIAGRAPRAAQGGFTLIELMVTIAIAGIVLSLAVPSMTTMIKNNRLQSAASSFVGDLQFARSEAIKRGQNVTVCPSADGSTCLGANTWHKGWMVFSDLGTVGTFDATKDVSLRVRAPLINGDTAVGGTGVAGTTAPANNWISFNREGFASGGGAGTEMVKFNAADAAVKSKRCVSVDLTGRLTTVIDGVASMGVSC